MSSQPIDKNGLELLRQKKRLVGASFLSDLDVVCMGGVAGPKPVLPWLDQPQLLVQVRCTPEEETHPVS